jgi:uncharacterized membrane protein YdjX (TVP38/TMEM64 family)
MRRLLAALTAMDAKAWRAALVTLGLLAVTVAILMFGKTELGRHLLDDFEAWLKGFSGSPWGLVAAIAVFTAAAYIGAPQFVLIAACVVAFGPWLGFLYSWIATVASAAATYWTGRLTGARALERLGGRAASHLFAHVGRNAFTASFVIRNVPSAPFILVNMAFGAARASFPAFLAGCALGVLPKTALVSFFGASFAALGGRGGWVQALTAGGLGLAWLLLMLAARSLLRRRFTAPETAQEGDRP